MADFHSTDDILRGRLAGWYSVLEHGGSKRFIVRVVRYIDGRLYVHAPRRYITLLSRLQNQNRFSRWQPLLKSEIPSEPSYT